MKSPWVMLEEFEEKHGSFTDLLCRLTCTDEKIDAEVKRLLARHNTICWMCVAYEQGRSDELAASHLSTS